MQAIATQQPLAFDVLVATQQPRLLRLCAHLAGDAQAAEDLTQETMLIAWRQRAHLHDPNGFSHWLNAIARNVCRHYLRSQRRASVYLAHPGQLDDSDRPATTARSTDTSPELAADFDLEVELERAELITLLDRAMGLLPTETRGLLVQHYLEELPQAELAAKVGVNASALAVRLHRGKLALRHLLTSELSDEAIALGLVTPEATGWHPTRIWCFTCGQCYLDAKFNQDEGSLRLRCPGCCNSYDEDSFMTNSQLPALCRFRTCKPAYTTVLKSIYEYYIVQAQAGVVRCQHCGQELRIHLGTPPGFPTWENSIYSWCEQCQASAGVESWGSLTQSLPQVRQFWREHPRMRALPVRSLEIANTPAIVTGFESMTNQARIEVAFTTNTFELIYVERAK